MAGATVNLWLRGDNTLISGMYRAALEVPDGAFLTISSASGDFENDGKLTAKNISADINGGGGYGAGIGGAGEYRLGNGSKNSKGRAGTIIINGGTIIAAARDGAAIGGGDTTGHDGGGTIEINGGNVTAIATYGGAGIGSGWYADPISGTGDDGTVITIRAGQINASGNSSSDAGAAGIGGSKYSSSGVVRINNASSSLSIIST